MEQEAVLAMYDVRGIQKFIFRTNKVKEIMGASCLVEDIIGKALKFALEKEKALECSVISWEKKEDEDKEELVFLSNKEIQAQVLFIGGGNAYVLFRSRDLAVRVNKKMSRYILDHTYSLQLAVAMVEKTDSYKKDYLNVQNQMASNKAAMPFSGCLGGLPVVKMDDMTGYPISTDGKEKLRYKPEEGKMYCVESTLKLTSFYENVEKEGIEKKFENLITEYGKDSMIAVVHIDGNNMGMRIRDLMQDEEDYGSAVKRMRTISQNINRNFKDTYDKTAKHLREWVESDANQVLRKGTKDKPAVYIRKIITAGDDITFVCNAKIALDIVNYFIQDISKKMMYEAKQEDDLEKYGLSVCAGIAFINYHFPFSTAYQVAEACCDSAKSRAKEEHNREFARIGNWIDFQICRDVQDTDFKRNREKNYRISGGEWLLRRPYYVDVKSNAYEKMNKKNTAYSFRHFDEIFQYMTKKIPSSLAKELRNTYPLGCDAVERLTEFAQSRGYLLLDIGEDTETKENAETKEDTEARENMKVSSGYIELDGCQTAAWYDAVEMMDLYVRTDSREEGEKADGQN